MNWPKPEQKFEIWYKFVEPLIRKQFYEAFLAGIKYAEREETHRKSKKEVKCNT